MAVRSKIWSSTHHAGWAAISIGFSMTECRIRKRMKESRKGGEGEWHHGSGALWKWGTMVDAVAQYLSCAGEGDGIDT
eukprot:CAMPEP_0117681182 /NCGR_PEP_ID=MMETSP0804-20121206/18817_1 /TAXON_ID=1074897 /ORGANISM="Tetraselmis astigmatica, Strain CCMP880" /LENGTH=77 /DNA_ID=CAMNT_0005490865 /DNA_START=53 /DNA_END=283 /DNA_ORIENTATION=+